MNKSWAMKADRLADYLTQLTTAQQQQSQPEIALGLEVDYLPNCIGPADFAQELDYTIGSVHFVDSLPDGQPWEIDGAASVFRSGLELVFRGNARAAISRYLELTRQMVDASTPTFVGHLDKIKIQNAGDRYFCEQERWYQQQIEDTLQAITRAGCAIEVNTRGLYLNKTPTCYPSPWVLGRIQALKIPITLSSDAHRPDQLTADFTRTAILLFELGFRELQTWLNGRWQMVPFTPYGLTLPQQPN